MNPNLSGPQMRRAEVYRDEDRPDPRWGRYSGEETPLHVLDSQGKSMGRYADNEIEDGAGSHSWNEEQGLQGALFPGPKQTDHGYKETRSVRSVREQTAYDNPESPPEPSQIVQDTIAKSDIPRRDLLGINTSVHVHSSGTWEDENGDSPLAKAGRSFFRPKNKVGGGDQIHMAPGQESDRESLTHELGHAVHFAGAEQGKGGQSAGGENILQEHMLTPLTGWNQHPHPVLEGTADGYADRYSGDRDHLVTPSPVMPQGDSALRSRASQVFDQSHDHHIGYTGKYEKSASDSNQTQWNNHDRARYLAARQFVGMTGSPMTMNQGAPVVGLDKSHHETGQMLLMADEAHYRATGQVENKQLDDMIGDALMPKPLHVGERIDAELAASRPETARSDADRAALRKAEFHRMDVDYQPTKTAGFLKDARETAIKYPSKPRGYQPTSDDPRQAKYEGAHKQLTMFDPNENNPRLEGENYRLSVHQAKQVARRDGQR